MAGVSNCEVQRRAEDVVSGAGAYQQERSTAGSQNSGPTVGGLMYRAAASLAPGALFKGGPPGIPGKPRPAPLNTGARPGAVTPDSS